MLETMILNIILYYTKKLILSTVSLHLMFLNTIACMAEMGRYPLSFKIWSLSIKYWMRLANGTNNVLQNNAFQTVKEENHEWLQNIKYLLNLHGFGKQWNKPNSKS